MPKEQKQSIIRGVLELSTSYNMQGLITLLAYAERNNTFSGCADLTFNSDGNRTFLFDTYGGEELVCEDGNVKKWYRIEDFDGTFDELYENYRSGDFNDNDDAMEEFIQLAKTLDEKLPLMSSQFKNDIEVGKGYFKLTPKFWSDTLNADNEPIATLSWVEEYSGVSELQDLIAELDNGYRYFGSLNEAATWGICNVEECRKVFDDIHGAYPSVHDYRYHKEFTPEELDAIIDTLKLNYDI